MSDFTQVRIVARVRPPLKGENERDIVVTAKDNTVTVPNTKNENEIFTFPFSAVYGPESDQQSLFSEVSPTLKHLFKGKDVTLFAYGATGSGKTHTMQGNKSAADRGIIPRLLTAICRRGKELEKKSAGELDFSAILTCYELYNDRVFDLFEAPEKRTLAGLPVREFNGKTVVVGLTEQSIRTLKEFESYYDKANNNRSTSATKLNAHSSRSHAVMSVRVLLQNNNTGETQISTVSCIDLAGSEDNRRTCNDKERMTESASINKSLFALSQCVEAMIKKQSRIPFRESKMTRILSLGQNNSLTVMILNLSPTRACQQDTIAALNFANRTKKVEIKVVDKEPTMSQLPRSSQPSGVSGHAVRAFGTAKSTSAHNRVLGHAASNQKHRSPEEKGKAAKVHRAPLTSQPLRPQGGGIRKPLRTSDPVQARKEKEVNIEDIVEKKVEEILAARALNESSIAPAPDMQAEVNKRLELLEKRLEKKADARSEGLTYILLAKQHAARNEDFSALKMYQLALSYFPDNAKLLKKISDLEERRKGNSSSSLNIVEEGIPLPIPRPKPKKAFAVFNDNDMETVVPPPVLSDSRPASTGDLAQTPRTRRLLQIINEGDVIGIMKLKGVGSKRAELITARVRERTDGDEFYPAIKDLEELGLIKGIGSQMVEKMRSGIDAQ